MKRRALASTSPLLLAALLTGACDSPATDLSPAAPAHPAAPATPADPGTGCTDCGDPQPTEPAAPPQIGAITLRRTQQVLFGTVFTDWSVNAALSGESPRSSAIGPCRLTPTPWESPSLDAGELTVSGGVYAPLRLGRSLETGAYEMVVSDDDLSDGTLFLPESQLQVAAAGGAEIRSLAQQGAWTGVSHLDFVGPKTLESLPDDALKLSWIAAPSAGASVLISLRAPDLRIDCPVAQDGGSYTVPAEVLAAMPAGPIYVDVDRVAAASATTTPGRGAVRLESRSGWRIVTSK